MNHITIVSPGKTTFKRGEVISREAFDKENERVSRLGEKPATGMYFNEEGEAIEVLFSTNGEPPIEPRPKYYYCDNAHLHPNNEVLQIKTLEDNPKCPYCGGIMTYGRYWGPLLATQEE